MESRADLGEEVPRLYRAALDAVDELSQLGLRQDAAKLRDRAIRVYSHSWDGNCRETLERVQRDAKVASISAAARLGRPLPGAN